MSFLRVGQRRGCRRTEAAAISDFASAAASFYDGVVELEVYAAGARGLNKILERDIEPGPISAGLRPKTKTQLLKA